MKLQVGERLHGTGPVHQPGGYLVTDVVRETPWYGLYTGKKILYNFDFAAKRVRETEAKEWLDIYLRTLHYPHLDDPSDVAQRRALARAEVAILGNRGSNLWPEAIDLLELPNTRDAFTFPPSEDDREPIVVFARPHGQPLGDWQQGVVPIASLLSVLAELLEFVRQAHTEGLLLQGLGPAAIVVDRADRVHYIGSDMVTELKDWDRVRRLFPPERFPRGFAAPEFFEADQHPSPRGDLYAWGTLAYFLFTGHMPWQIALDQGRPWAEFHDAHFQKLDKALRQIPPAHVQAWAEQLGIDGAALVQEWPGNFVALMRWLLHSEPARRPQNADEVRSWMVALPPMPVTAVLAIAAGGGEVRIYLDFPPLPVGAQIEIRRAVGHAPEQSNQGDLAYAGSAVTMVVDSQAPLTEEPYFYTVFTRRPLPAGAVYSSGVSSQALEPSPEDLLPLAEAEAEAATGEQEPPRLGLCFRAMNPVGLAEMLLFARAAAVRGWALRRLGDRLAQQPSPEVVELVRRCLRDADDAVRRRALVLLWQQTPERTDDALLALFHEMSQGQIDEAIQAARTINDVSLPAEQLQRVAQRLESERPTACPLCSIPLTRREWVNHLLAIHDHVEFAGSLTPRAEAEDRLWDRVFSSADARAHRQLVDLYAATGANLVEAYSKSFEAQLIRRPELDEATDASEPRRHIAERWEPWLACMRKELPVQPLAALLLRSESARVRAAGRVLLLPYLAERLRNARLGIPEMRQTLETTLPGADLLGERIRLCKRLPQFGVDPEITSACQVLFEEELPVRCPECPAKVRALDLEVHLRRAHNIFQFRGERRSYSATRDHLLECVCGSRSDVAAWRSLVGVADDRYGPGAAERLTAWICRTLKNGERDQRDQTVATVAEAVARADTGERLVPILLGDTVQSSWKNLARHLALAVVAQTTTPWPEAIVAQIKPYLSAKDIPSDVRLQAVAGLLRSQGQQGPATVEILHAYVSASAKARAVERLLELENLVGQSPVLDAYVAALEDRIRMTCPRCQDQLERRDMVKHLWDKHRLLLEGRRVREPWRVLADWVVDYGLEKDPALLDRCRELARKTDPEDGPFRLQRLLLRQGVEDREAWAALVARARQRGASLCPHCYAMTQLPVVVPPLPLDGTESLEGHGFLVQIHETGLTPRLVIQTPAGLAVDDREPGALLTRLGAMLALAGPVVLAAFGLLYGLLGASIPGVFLVFLALGLSLFLGGLIYLVWPHRALRPRLLDAAWTQLAPDLLSQPWSEATGAFLGSLAATSVGQFVPEEDVLAQTIQAIQDHPAHEAALVPLWRLQGQSVADHGDDPVPLLVAHVANALEGKLPLRLVGPLIGDARQRWSTARLARFQALVCAQAAEAGLVAADLADLARAQPILGAELGSADLDHFAQLRLFWAVRERWPAVVKSADTVFDLARDADSERLLAERPDLLCNSRTSPIYVGTRGVWLKDACLTDEPARIEVVTSRWQDGEGFEVVAGGQRAWFTTDPQSIADELKTMVHFYFRDFLPQLSKQASRRSGDAVRRLWRANAVPCPECHHSFVPLVGEVGLRLAESEAQLAS